MPGRGYRARVGLFELVIAQEGLKTHLRFSPVVLDVLYYYVRHPFLRCHISVSYRIGTSDKSEIVSLIVSEIKCPDIR